MEGLAPRKHARRKETAVTFGFRKARATTADPRRPRGGWYSDPYGAAARRWYEHIEGWTDRVQGAGLEPDKTGVARVDEATASSHAETEHPELERL